MKKPTYLINEIFTSIQGEGAFTGLPMTFVRFAGCNLNCYFCDTSHRTLSELTAEEILEKVKESKPMHVCITGGEPLVQDAATLGKFLRNSGYVVHLETNGSLEIPTDVFAWVTVSPKTKTSTLLTNLLMADEVKWLVGDGLELYKDYEDFMFANEFLQPVHQKLEENTWRAYRHALMSKKEFRLSFQVHKLIHWR